MNEQITNKAGAILDLMLQWMNGAASLASKELPLLFEEYVKYYIWEHIPLVSGSIAIIALVCTILLLLNKDTEAKCFAWLPGLILIGALIGVGNDLRTMAQVYFAPKAYLIESFRKGGCK